MLTAPLPALSCPAHPPGLANPGPIIAELWTDEELEAAVTLDGVVTLVDGRNIGRQLGEARPAGQPNEAQLQVALADVILLNKVGAAVGCCWMLCCAGLLHQGWCRWCGKWPGVWLDQGGTSASGPACGVCCLFRLLLVWLK